MDDSADDPPMLLASGVKLQECTSVGEAELRRVPVTIITGFLGAGKTTLLQRLLTEQCAKKYAVIMNEMAPGSGSIESAFFQAVNRAQVQKSDAAVEETSMLSALSEWIDLPGGCLCCAKNAGLRAIERLIERRDDIDHILIETSGVADPYSLILTFWTDAEMKSSVRLNGVIAVIDVRHAKKWLLDELEMSTSPSQVAAKHGDAHSESDLRRVFWNQISLSDLLILNKLDLLSDVEKQTNDVIGAVELRLADLNPFARREKCSFAQIEQVGVLLDSLRAYDPATIEELRQMASTSAQSGDGDSQSQHNHVSLQAVKVVFSRAEYPTCVFDKAALQQLFTKLVWDTSGHPVVRLKAMALVANDADLLTWLHVQAVNELLDETELCASERECANLELGMFVFIGRNVDQVQLHCELLKCLST